MRRPIDSRAGCLYGHKRECSRSANVLTMETHQPGMATCVCPRGLRANQHPCRACELATTSTRPSRKCARYSNHPRASGDPSNQNIPPRYRLPSQHLPPPPIGQRSIFLVLPVPVALSLPLRCGKICCKFSLLNISVRYHPISFFRW